MRCRECGSEVPPDASFCGNCGASAAPVETERETVAAQAFAPVPPPADPPEAPLSTDRPPVTRVMPTSAPPPGGYPPDPGPPGPRATGEEPGGPGRRGLWIAIAVIAVVVLALAVAIPLVLARGNDAALTTTTVTSETAPSTTSSTAVETTSTTEPESSSTTSSSTTTTVVAGDPGDSDGEWVEMDLPDVPGAVMEVSVSETFLLATSHTDELSRIFAYDFVTGESTTVPIESPEFGGIDVDGSAAVWWEGIYDETDNTYLEQHIYAFELPNGPRVEVVGGDADVYYPQIAGLWVTWIEGGPWEENPEEYWHTPIYGTLLPDVGQGAGGVIELAPYAVAAIMGDAVWVYSLSEKYLAWEQTATNGGLDPGTYVLDLSDISAQPGLVGTEAWRPSLANSILVYWENGLKGFDLSSGDGWDIDPSGDFATAGPTFAAYFRPVAGEDQAGYEIVARGFTGEHEQVLATQSDPPWFSPFIAASAAHVAFVADGSLHVFEWKGQ